MRLPYIKFFISSTFLDMKVERDILQNVFSILKDKYREKGWVIDYVDLRWGISSAESKDNKTIEICLTELERCQKLSPKPNFIVLLGERRGWIPLPERIPIQIAHRIIKKVTKEQRVIFEKWYVADQNWYPTPQYELLAQDHYGDIRAFEKDYIVLEKIFAKYSGDIYGLSATELEVDKGLFKGASGHVLAYVRRLTSVPSEKRATFQENSIGEIWKRTKLYAKVKNSVPRENYIERKVSFDLFESDRFKNELFEEFYNKISQLIDREIESNEKIGSLDTEIAVHEAFVAEESSKIIGRENEIKCICEWLEEKGRKDPLWIIAPSGTGKSTLLAAVSNRYVYGSQSGERNVISIFCGLTPATSTARGMLTYLMNQLSRITGEIYHQSPYLDNSFDFNGVKNAIVKAAMHKPLLIVIDSIDRLDFGDIWKNDLFSCFPSPAARENRWTEHEEKVRIIVSSLNTSEWTSISSIKPTVIDGITDCESFVAQLLRRKNRKLTERQNELLESTLKGCDNRPVYLVLLVSLLAGVKSHMIVDWIPKNLNELVETYLDWLIHHKKIDERLVKIALGLICESCGGIRHSDILQLLGKDDAIWNQIKEEAAHQLPAVMENSRCVPSMVWSRLYYDLMPVLRSKQNSLFGETIDINHPALKTSIQNLLGSEIRDYAKVSLRVYFENLLSSKDYLALDRIINLQIQDDSQDFLGISGVNMALSTLLSPDFYIPRKTYFGNKLEDDAGILFSHDTRATDAQKLRRDLYWMPQETEGSMLRRVLNLPDNSVAKRSMTPRFQCNDLLVNALRNESISTTELYYLSPLTQASMIGPDSVVGYSLKKATFLYSSASDGEKDLGTKIVYGDSYYKILLVDGYYMCGVRKYEDNFLETILWDWKKECAVAIWRGMTHEPLWMAYDGSNGFIYVGNDTEGTYRYSFHDGRILISNDLAFNSRSDIGDKSLVFLSNNGNYLWVEDGIDENHHWRSIRYFKVQEYFERSAKTNGRIYIPMHLACPICYFYIDEIRKKWYVFYLDGGCAVFEWPSIADVQDMFPKEIRYTYAVTAVWIDNSSKQDGFSDIVYAFSWKRGIIFDFQKQYIMIGKDFDGFASANSLSTSTNGSKICMSYGYGGRVGCYSMKEVFVIDVKDPIYGRIVRKNIRIPFKFDFVRLSLISPDGSVIAFATNGEEERVVTASKIGIVSTNYPEGDAYCWKVPELIFQIKFSPSGKYVFFLGGDDMAMCYASLYVLDMQGKLISSFASKHIVMDPYMVIFEQAGKVAAWDTTIVSDGKGMHVRIYDVANNRESRIDLPKYEKDKGSDRIVLSGVLLNTSGCLVLCAGRTIYLVDLWKEKLIEQRLLPQNMEIKAVYDKDSKLWLIDHTNCLYLYDLYSNRLDMIKKDVSVVFPTIDGSHIYTVNSIFDTKSLDNIAKKYKKDTIVCYCKIDGTVDKHALLRAGAGKCCLTENGLLISDYNNDLLLFNPNSPIEISNASSG